MLEYSSSAPRSESPPRVRNGFSLVVVVPVRNEEQRLERCLSALDRTRQCVLADPGQVASVKVVVVLDRCTDGSADIAAARSWLDIVVTDHGRVGAARASGVATALSRSDHPLASTWIACTDGDSAVPANWLQTHLMHARAGVDLLLGMVRPDPRELGPSALRAWCSKHPFVDGHPHVFGANLGIRAEIYLRSGGFADVRVHEDRHLAGAVRRLNGRVVSIAAAPVLTSGRLLGRTGAGFAQYLRAMDQGDQPSRPAAPATEMAGGRT